MDDTPRYRDVECHNCGKFVPQNLTVKKTVREEIGYIPPTTIRSESKPKHAYVEDGGIIGQNRRTRISTTHVEGRKRYKSSIVHLCSDCSTTKWGQSVGAFLLVIIRGLGRGLLGALR